MEVWMFPQKCWLISLHGRKNMPKEYGVEEYVNILLAIIQVESGGTAEDVMQSSESLGLPPNSLSTEESISKVWSISVNY